MSVLWPSTRGLYQPWDERGVVRAAKGGDPRAMEAVVSNYDPMCRSMASDYYITGAGRDDVLQEARIGIMRAVASYDLAAETPFGAFARMCVTRAVITAVIGARRMKHDVLSGSVRVGTTDDGKEVEVLDLLPAGSSADPFAVVVARERMEALIVAVGTLTELERRAVIGISDGASYAAIAGLPDGSGKPKSIDNAAQRGRAKLRDAA